MGGHAEVRGHVLLEVTRVLERASADLAVVHLLPEVVALVHLVREHVLEDAGQMGGA